MSPNLGFPYYGGEWQKYLPKGDISIVKLHLFYSWQTVIWYIGESVINLETKFLDRGKKAKALASGIPKQIEMYGYV